MRNKLKKRRKRLYLFIYIFCIIIIIISLIYILNNKRLEYENIREKALLSTIDLNKIENNIIEENGLENEIINEMVNKEINEEKIAREEVIKETERMLKVKELKKDNPDIVGWIEIGGTNINYPVLQGEDDYYYLTHNYKKEKMKNGAIFLTSKYDWNIPNNNYIIYGHNKMSSDQMFSDLLKYADEEFYNNHPIIRLTTEEEDKEYKIISVFKSRVYYKSEKNVFRYYNFINSESEEKYNSFINNAKKVSLYNIEETPKFGQQLLTLITCSYHTEDGRFVVIASEKNLENL